MNKKIFLLIALVVILYAVWVRIYQLGLVPSGLTNDEADIGYDAYSILKTGRDQWGHSLPLNGFRGFGDYRPVLYTYLVVPAVAVFKLSPFAVRLPSALFGIASIFIFYLVVKKIYNNKTAYVAMLLLCVSPWSIGMSRLGIESNVAIFFLLTGIYFLLSAGQSLPFTGLAVLSLAATFYLYTAYTLFIPLFVLTVLFFYKHTVSKNKTALITGALIFIVLLAPFFSVYETGFFSRAKTEGFLVNTSSIGIVQDINEKRGSCLRYVNNSLLCRIVANKAVEFASVFVGNYLHHFSVDYLFLTGNPVHRVILPEMGLSHLFELPLLILGFYVVFKKIKETENKLLITLFFLSAIPSTLTGNGNFSRLSMMMPFMLTIESLGTILLADILWRKRKYYLLLAITSTAITVSIFLFTINYFTYYRSKYSEKLTYKEIVKDIVDNKNRYGRIYISRHNVDSEMHIFYLFYTAYDPERYQSKNDILHTTLPNGWSRIDKIESINFVDKIPEKPFPNSLLIATPKDFPQNIKPEKIVKSLGGGDVFYEVETDSNGKMFH